MPTSSASEIERRLDRITVRLQELNNTSSQILIFLSFAIVAAVTFLGTALAPVQKIMVNSALRWWIGAIFPTVIAIAPLKEVKEGSLPWYRFLEWMRFLLMWAAIVSIFIGAIQFFRSIQ